MLSGVSSSTALRNALFCLGVLIPLSAFALPEPVEQPLYAINCGGSSSTDAEGVLFATDMPYGTGAGYVGGMARTPSRVLNSAAWSTRDPALHYKVREGMSAYRFDLPPGDYLVRLYWLESLVHGPRLRVFDLSAEGLPLLNGLDLGADPGFMAAREQNFLVNVSDGTLDLEFSAQRRASLLSAVAVWPATDTGQAPPAPVDFALRPGYGMNILTWEADYDPAHALLRIESAASPGGPFDTLIETRVTAARHFDLTAPTGEDRWYRLRTVDCWGRESAPTAALTAKAIHWSESELAVIRLSLAEADLDSLNAYPRGDTEYPALCSMDGSPYYSVAARYRGGMARYFRKKSWKLELPGQLDYLGLRDLHLIANPDDLHLIKNEVGLRIFDELIPWSSSGTFVHLEFDGEYWGVYELVEEVDEDFLARRGVYQPGTLYKAYSDMRVLYSHANYVDKYEQKAGPELGHADLIAFIEGLAGADETELPPFLDANLDLDAFFDYYAMMIYTRQVDFISRNYYLYRDRDNARWQFIPWDMNIAFHWDDLPLDFATEASPHWAWGTWNRLIDKVLSVPRLRLEFARRLGDLNASVLNRDHLSPLVDSIYDSLAVDGALDVHKAWYEDNTHLDLAAGLTNYRLGERDDQLVTMLPAFISAIPTVCINELQIIGGGPVDGGRNQWSSWLELYNFGDGWVELGALELSADDQPGSGVNLPTGRLGPGERELIYLDHRMDLGPNHLPLAPDPQGGQWVLMSGMGGIWDRVRYGAADAGLAEGRHPDGWITWRRMPATPHLANLELQAPRITSAILEPAGPGAADSLRISASVSDPADLDLQVSFHYSLATGDEQQLALARSGLGQWEGVAPPAGGAGELRWWIHAENALGLASNDPPGAPYFHHSVLILPESSRIFLNELMADNDTVIVDEEGDYDDWIEIYNAGPDTLDLSGYGLSDELDEPLKWRSPVDPASRIPPGEWLLVWADEEEDEGPLHAAFKLSRDGEELGLFAPDGSPVDMISFGPQASDLSYGRASDGELPWIQLATPSPGTANAGAGAAGTPIFMAWPNPFNPELQLALELVHPTHLRLSIYDMLGRRLQRLWDGDLAAGSHRFRWDGRDEAGNQQGSGVYLARLEYEAGSMCRKLLLIK